MQSRLQTSTIVTGPQQQSKLKMYSDLPGFSQVRSLLVWFKV